MAVKWGMGVFSLNHHGQKRHHRRIGRWAEPTKTCFQDVKTPVWKWKKKKKPATKTNVLLTKQMNTYIQLTV